MCARVAISVPCSGVLRGIAIADCNRETFGNEHAKLELMSHCNTHASGGHRFTGPPQGGPCLTG
jgi:hypothetical protein